MQADAEHQQDDADLGELRGELAVGDEAGRERADGDARQQVADERRQLQPDGDEAADEREREADGDRRDQRGLVGHGVGGLGRRGRGRCEEALRYTERAVVAEIRPVGVQTRVVAGGRVVNASPVRHTRAAIRDGGPPAADTRRPKRRARRGPARGDELATRAHRLQIVVGPVAHVVERPLDQVLGVGASNAARATKRVHDLGDPREHRIVLLLDAVQVARPIGRVLAGGMDDVVDRQAALDDVPTSRRFLHRVNHVGVDHCTVLLEPFGPIATDCFGSMSQPSYEQFTCRSMRTGDDKNRTPCSATTCGLRRVDPDGRTRAHARREGR